MQLSWLSTLCFMTSVIVPSALCAISHGAGVVDDSPQARILFNMSDFDQNGELTRNEFHQVFLDFDLDVNGNVTKTEFMSHWNIRQLGPEAEGQTLFANLDVNSDHEIDEHIDLPHIIRFFDRDANDHISEGEFVIQWVKIST